MILFDKLLNLHNIIYDTKHFIYYDLILMNLTRLYYSGILNFFHYYELSYYKYVEITIKRKQ